MRCLGESGAVQQRRDTPFRADLHLHTSVSDGVSSPGELLRWAKESGMSVVAITDHDTVDGVAEAAAAGEVLGVTALAGLELTVGGEEEIHLLGYGLNPLDRRLRAFLEAQNSERRGRMQTMLDRLASLGMPVTQEDLGDGDSRFMGRLNLARAMAALGYVGSVREAFDRFLRPGKPAYCPRRYIEVPRGIEMLRAFGAVVSLAHPGRLAMDRHALALRLPGWIEAGLQGIEAYHTSHQASQAQLFDRMARSSGLLVTGGSDCHGRMPGGAQIGDHLGAWGSVREDVAELVALTTKEQ